MATLDVRPARTDICGRSDGLCFRNAVVGGTLGSREGKILYHHSLLTCNPDSSQRTHTPPPHHCTTSRNNPAPVPTAYTPTLHSLYLGGMQGGMDHSTEHVRTMDHHLDLAAAQRDNPVP